jgi:phospholipase/carboxylesterase
VAHSFLAALTAVDELLGAECDAVGIGTDRCVVGGFSQGGFLALALAGRVGAPRYAGVWAMCCALPQVDGVELDLAAAAGTPVLVQLGEHDAIITPDRSRAASAALADAGWDVTERAYDMAHSQRLEMLADARDWLGTIA